MDFHASEDPDRFISFQGGTPVHGPAMRLYPLKFEPIFKPAIWGGQRLLPFLGRPQSAQAIGEAWVVSDVDGSSSVVCNGPLASKSLRELLTLYCREILGEAQAVQGRFPLLLKFIDAKTPLSVQVHPNDEQARRKDPRAAGKTEAWVVLDSNPQTSRIFAGFRPGVTAASFLHALETKSIPRTLHEVVPRSGDCFFLQAGTVHAIGADLLVFEVQQTSDITYRLYDWDRIDASTGKPRTMHIEDGLECSNFALGPCQPQTPVALDDTREELARCAYFILHRLRACRETIIGHRGRCTAYVCIEGHGTIAGESIATGEVLLLPAVMGTAPLVPRESITLLECGLP